MAKQVTESLLELADLLIKKRGQRINKLVVPFVGAGASIAAGLPSSARLMHLIYQGLVGRLGEEDTLREAIDEEARALFPGKANTGVLKLSLFEFVSVVTRFAYGRRVLHQVVNSELRKATHRPLAYELLAHMAKHGFVDHIVSLNFDTLLDEALEDELPERLKILAAPDDIPGPNAIRQSVPSDCYLVKPFGSLRHDKYKLSPEEVRRFGNDSLWHFLLERILSQGTGNHYPDIILILIGYAATEIAFSELVRELAQQQRKVSIYVIDPREQLLLSDLPCSIFHVRLEADSALSMLIQTIKHQYISGADELGTKNERAWIPVARHQIISRFLKYEHLENPKTRFKIEVLLQAVKSRGFFTIDAIGEISRIRKYDKSASQSIIELVHEKIIEPHKGINYDSTSDSSASRPPAEDYCLTTDAYMGVAEHLLSITEVDGNESIQVWDLTHNEGLITAVPRAVKKIDYLSELLAEIAEAPEIEVVHTGPSSSSWLLKKAVAIPTLEALTEITANMLNSYLSYDGSSKIQLIGAWATAEWLFHSSGWAYSLGRRVLKLIEENRLELKLILVSDPMSPRIRTIAHDVRNVLKEANRHDNVTLYGLDWWRHNRRFTLLTLNSANTLAPEGIYMRRRLFTPIVAPFHIIGTDNALRLNEVFNWYAIKCEHGQRQESSS